jgi:hypothetical protein
MNFSVSLKMYVFFLYTKRPEILQRYVYMCLFFITSAWHLWALLIFFFFFQTRELKITALIIDSTSICSFLSFCNADYLHIISPGTVLTASYLSSHDLHFPVFLLYVERGFLHLIFWSQTQYLAVLITLFTFKGAAFSIRATCNNVSAPALQQWSTVKQ